MGTAIIMLLIGAAIWGHNILSKPHDIPYMVLQRKVELLVDGYDAISLLLEADPHLFVRKDPADLSRISGMIDQYFSNYMSFRMLIGETEVCGDRTWRWKRMISKMERHKRASLDSYHQLSELHESIREKLSSPVY